MKKLLLFFLVLSICLTFVYPQTLKKTETPKHPVKIQMNFSIEKPSGILTSSFIQSFEETTFPPTGWKNLVGDGGIGWSKQTVGSPIPGWSSGTISSPPNGGNSVAYCTKSIGSTFDNQTLVTPLIQNIQKTDTLFFWMKNQINIIDTIKIYYTTDLSNWNEIGNIFYPNSYGTDWGRWYTPIGLSIPTGSNVYLGIQEFVSNNLISGGAISMDLVEIKGTITLNKTFSFNDLSTSSYRMIGLPGSQVTKISDLISGTQKTDWDAFYDNGADASFLQEFDGSSTFNFTPGIGFWILSKNSFNVNATVSTVSLSADNTFSIHLHSGFNIISDPFEKSVSWGDIQNLNGLSTNDILFDWSGAWTHATQMDPYKGYYFKNTNNLTSLKIPYTFSIAKTSVTNSQWGETYSGNFIKLSLIQNNQVKSFIVAGFNSSAKKDYDKFDCFAPPGYFDQERINIEDQNISDSYKQLSVDYRPEIGDGQTFNLKIKDASKEVIKLSADGIDNFTGYQVYLLDENLNRFYNLKEKSEIDISPIHQNSNYKLLIGKENFINDIKKDLVPVEFSLYQNYPNPFNPSTLIKYQIPNDNILVVLKIYNVLGKEIKTLVNEIQNQGNYEVEFNASNFSSGIYFYSINAGNFSATKKMILIR